MASIAYDNGLDLLGGGTESGDSNWESASWVAVGVKSGYTPSKAHQYLSDLTNELSGSGYSRSSVSGIARFVDGTNHRIDFQCDDPDFGSVVAGETLAGVVIALDTGIDATAALVVFLEQSPGRATDGTPLIYTLSEGAIARLAQA